MTIILPVEKHMGTKNAGKSQDKIVATTSSPVCKRNVFSRPEGIPRSNCYAYALQLGRGDGPYYKLQPGDLSTKKSFGLTSCAGVRQRTLDDLAFVGGYEEKVHVTCKRGYYKIALILSPEMDYHYLLLHKDIVYVAERGDTRASIAKKFSVPVSNVEQKATYATGTSVYVKGANVWSHKRGAAYAPTLVDSANKIIKDPRKATFDYGVLNYSTFCTTFCVKKRPDYEPCTVTNKTCRRDKVKRLTVTSVNAQTAETVNNVIKQLKNRVSSNLSTGTSTNNVGNTATSKHRKL